MVVAGRFVQVTRGEVITGVGEEWMQGLRITKVCVNGYSG